MRDGDDLYCVKIRRYGALGIEEEAGRLDLHRVERSEVEMWLDVTMNTLGPGDSVDLTISHGVQVPRVG